MCNSPHPRSAQKSELVCAGLLREGESPAERARHVPRTTDRGVRSSALDRGTLGELGRVEQAASSAESLSLFSEIASDGAQS